MTVLQLDSTTFQPTITGDTPVIVDFYAEWCGPCQALAPLLHEVAEEFKGRVVVAKVNVDENPEVASPFQIRSIPTLLAFKKGQKTHTHVGGMTKGQLVEWVESILG